MEPKVKVTVYDESAFGDGELALELYDARLHTRFFEMLESEWRDYVSFREGAKEWQSFCCEMQDKMHE